MIDRPLDTLVCLMCDVRRHNDAVITAFETIVYACGVSHGLHTMVAKLLHALGKHLVFGRDFHPHIPMKNLASMHMHSRFHRTERSKRVLSDGKSLIKDHTFRKKAHEIRHGAESIAAHRRPGQAIEQKIQNQALALGTVHEPHRFRHNERTIRRDKARVSLHAQKTEFPDPRIEISPHPSVIERDGSLFLGFERCDSDSNKNRHIRRYMNGQRSFRHRFSQVKSDIRVNLQIFPA